MNTVIVYSTTHGTTEKVANMVNNLSGGNILLINLKKVKDIDLSKYDKIIIGGSIHAGTMQKRVRKFCESHMQELTTKPLGLFLSCMDEVKAKEQFITAFPEALRNHATSTKLTGGEVLFEKMNFLEKIIMKKMGGLKESVHKLNDDQIEELAKEMGLC